VTGITPHMSNPNSIQKNFSAAVLGEEPPALAFAPAPALGTTHAHGAMVDSETEDRIAASTTILALDPAAHTSRAKYDAEEDTTLPPALTRATAAPAWHEDDTPLGPADYALCTQPRPMDATLDDVSLQSFQVESEAESSDEESVFDVMGL
jgi:hypothetical protein